jgi:Cof subfamily protein (haloacid dehalogenase superfamily)
MAYRLIASDIDGTLTFDGISVSDRCRRTIAALRERGQIFTLCTGRNIAGAKNFLPLLTPETPIITYHGSVITTPEGRILYENRLTAESTRRILELGAEKKATILVWHDGKMFAREMSRMVVDYEKFCGEPVIRIGDFSELFGISASKIIWFDEADVIRGHIKQLDTVDTDGFTYHTSHPCFLEFISGGASKGQALLRVAEMLRIAREEIIAVGDGMNDLSMIECAGLGVAMGNASQRLKNAADFIAPECERDGLAYVIERFML